jgi:hypothetical protein
LIGPGQGKIPQLRDLNPTIGGTAKRTRPPTEIGTVKGVQGELKMRVSMLQAQKVAVHPDADAQLFQDLPAQTLLQCFPLLLLPAGKLPQSAQKPIGSSLGDKEPLTSPDDPRRDVMVRPLRAGREARQASCLARDITSTEGGEGALGTSRIRGATHQGTQIHQGLVKGASLPFRQQGFGQIPEAFEVSWGSWVIPEEEKATENPDRVPIKHGPGSAVGKAGQSGRCVVAHTGQSLQDRQLGGNLGFVIL